MAETELTQSEILQQLAQYRQLHQQRYTAQQPSSRPVTPQLPSSPQTPPPFEEHVEIDTDASDVPQASFAGHVSESYISPGSPSAPAVDEHIYPEPSAPPLPTFNPNPSPETQQRRLNCGSWEMLESIMGSDREPSSPPAHAGAPSSQAASSSSFLDSISSAVRQAFDFFSSSSSRSTTNPSGAGPASGNYEESDEALARRLQAEEEARWQWDDPVPPPRSAFQERLLPAWGDEQGWNGNNAGNGRAETDEELAYRLQMEEEQRARHFDRARQQHYVDRQRSGRQAPGVPVNLQSLLANMRGIPLPEEQERVIDPHVLFFHPLLGPMPDPRAAATILAILQNPQTFNRDDLDNASYEELLRLEEQLGVVSRGATTQQIDALPTTVLQAQDPTAQKNTCAICLEDFEAGQALRTLPCLHQFHKDCVDKWLQMNRCCPVCKTNIC